MIKKIISVLIICFYLTPYVIASDYAVLGTYPNASTADGDEITTEFNAIATASATKLDETGGTMTGAITFSGVATDITSVSNQDINITPNGTGNFIPSRMTTTGIGNLIENGSLEIWGAGTAVTPSEWALTGAAATVARSATVRIGTYSAAVTRVGNDCYLQQNIYTDAGSTHIQNRDYTFACWVYATVATRARLTINDGVGSTNSSYHTGDSTWQLLTVTRTMDNAATALNIRLQVDTGNTTANFDGATVTEGSTTFAFTQYPTDVTRFAIGSFTRDTAVASGNQAVTGVGFVPKLVIFFYAVHNDTGEMGWGFDEIVSGGNGFGVANAYDVGATPRWDITDVQAIRDIETANDVYWGEVTTFDNDGFTVAWTRSNAPSGTLSVRYIAFR